MNPHQETMLPVGVASVDITPPVGAVLVGYRDRASTSLGHRLRAEVLVVGSGRARWALVTADLLGFARPLVAELRRAISRRSGIAAGRILICATHTHSGPDTLSPRPARGEAAWRRRLITGIAGAVGDAARSAAPAVLEGASCRATAWLHNRRVRQADGSVRNEWRDPQRHHTGHVDDRVQLLGVRRPDGRLDALLVNFGCHPVTLGPQSLAISADYVGYLKDALERHGVGTVLFAIGGHGEINPPECIRTSPRHARRMGSAIARLVLAAMPDARALPGPPLAIRLPWRLHRGGGRPPISTEVMAVGAGPLAIVALPGELCSELAVTIRRMAGRQAHTLVLSLGNDYVGYLPTDRMRREGGHEGRSSPAAVERPLLRLAARALDRITRRTVAGTERRRRGTRGSA
jgi:neutral ceramidase